MPEPLSPAAEKRIEELLREGLSAVEVSRRCIGRWPLVTPARVRMEAYRLRIQLPHRGRPEGAKDLKPRQPYEPRSPYRARAVELRAEGHSLRATAALLAEEAGRSFTAEGIRKLTRSDDGNKK